MYKWYNLYLIFTNQVLLIKKIQFRLVLTTSGFSNDVAPLSLEKSKILKDVV